MALTPAMLAARKRLLDDFAFYAENCIRIRTKDQAIEPLILNAAQKRLVAVVVRQLETRGYIRLVVLKARQMGFSTVIGALLYWWVTQRKAQKALVVAHKGESTQNLFDMTRRFHDHCPGIMRPHTRYSSRKEIVFDKLDSSYTLVTAGGDGIARSDTITAAHLSELAFWPKSSAVANFSGLMDTIPAVPGTMVFIESTANGLAGLFYQQYQAAKKGESDFEAFFAPWFEDEGYRMPAPAGFTHTPEEEKLIEAYGLDDAQLSFRRIKIAEKGADLFKQEYPSNDEEAFLTSGRPVFRPDIIAEWLREKAQEPRKRLSLEAHVSDDGETEWRWESSPIGELAVYRDLDETETYYIGADVGGGVRQDFSVAQVFDSHRRQVAVWRSDRVDPERFGLILFYLGQLFGDCRIIVERNNQGILTNHCLHKVHEYGNVYTEVVVDKLDQTETEHIGFFTSEKTKPMVVNKLRAHIRDREIEVVDRTTLLELQTFVVTDSGRMAADGDCHDDCVLALAMCDHINEGPWTPIDAEGFYFTTE